MRHIQLDSSRLRRLIRNAVQVHTAPAVFEITGAGALTCLQGLLTNDLAGPGENSLVYGALLTPKGAIVVDYWVFRLSDRFLLLADPAGQAASLELLRRSLPPRLAKLRDCTSEIGAWWLYGHDAAAALGRSGLPAPERGKILTSAPWIIARPQHQAPFQALLLGPSAQSEELEAQLGKGGFSPGDEADRNAADVLAGWPRLGSEIDERTLVQEVRYDDIGGVSYTKGCYTGQETVARLHFRGHTNKELKGLVWQNPAQPDDSPVLDQDGKEVGTVSSMLSSSDRTIGMGVIRRTVEPGAQVVAGGVPATVVALPFDPGTW